MKRLNREELNKLPQNIINKVEGTLKAYDSVTIIFENGEYKTSTGAMLKAQYAEDYKVIGDVFANDIYDSDCRIINYIEEFMSYPIEYKGKKDWSMIKRLEELRHNQKIGKIGLDKEGNAIIKDIAKLQ